MGSNQTDYDCVMRLLKVRFAGGVCERMMACVICASHWDGNYCIACVTSSTSMVRLEVVTMWLSLSSCTVLPPCLTVIHQPDRSQC